MQESGGTLTVRTLFEKDNVVILFSDTGPGMRWIPIWYSTRSIPPSRSARAPGWD